MKKTCLFCLIGTLALSAASCDDDKDNNSGFSGKMAINGQTETINSALYFESAASDIREASLQLSLLRDVLTEKPENDPDCYITIVLSESLYSKTIDLTKPIVKSGGLDSGLHLGAKKTSDPYFGINYTSEGKIQVFNSVSGPSDATVKAGTLTATRSGNDFTVRLSVTLSDGNSIAADWKGTATKLEKTDDLSVLQRN